MDKEKLIRTAEHRIKKYNYDYLKKIGILPINDDHHMPTVIYPDLKDARPADDKTFFRGITSEDIHPFLLYIHIPFCLTLCSFCQFDTCPYTSSSEIDKYINYLEKEIALWKKNFPSLRFSPSSIFIGGGTPSLLNPIQWSKLLKIINKEFSLKKCKQFSVDAEPRTLTGKKGLEKLKIMKEGGIHRICLGAQSFNNKILKQMRRSHNSKDIFQAAKQIKKINFKSLSLDLIFGFPGCTLDSWINDLQTAKKINPDGYQLHQLRVINFRPKGLKKISLKEKLKESSYDFLPLKDVYLMKILGDIISQRNGYKHYGRGIYLKGAEHNSRYLQLSYSKRFNCIGLGKGAFTGIKQKGYLILEKGLERYYQLIDKNLFPMTAWKENSAIEETIGLFIMSLKNSGIIYKKYFKKKTGYSLYELSGSKIKKFKDLGLMKENDTSLSFTQKGMFFDDDILFHFYDPKNIPFKKSDYSDGPMNPFKK